MKAVLKMQIQLDWGGLQGVNNFCAYYSKNSKTIKSRRFVYRRLAEKLLLHKYEVLNKTKKRRISSTKKTFQTHIFPFPFIFFFCSSFFTIFLLVTERPKRKNLVMNFNWTCLLLENHVKLQIAVINLNLIRPNDLNQTKNFTTPRSSNLLYLS